MMKTRIPINRYKGVTFSGNIPDDMRVKLLAGFNNTEMNVQLFAGTYAELKRAWIPEINNPAYTHLLLVPDEAELGEVGGMMKSQEKLTHISLHEFKPGEMPPNDFQLSIHVTGGGVATMLKRGDSIDEIVYKLERMIHMLKESTQERIGPMAYADYPDHLVKVAERNGFIFEQKNKQWLSYSGLLIARSADELERYLIRYGYLTIRE